MFNWDVLSLTVQKVVFLLIFIATGYYFRRSGRLTHQSAVTLSVLTTQVFSVSYNLTNLPKYFTMEKLSENLKIMGFAAGMLVFFVLLANVLSRFTGRDDFEKRSLTYAFAFSNNTYFGLPVVAGVFGPEMVAKYLVFCVTINIGLNSYGYALFVPSKGGGLKINWKRAFLSPMFLATVVGAILGLTGISFPGFVHDALTGAAACMSPASMLLGGIVLGGIPVKKLLTGIRPYLLALIRLLGIPLVTGGLLYLFGVRGIYFFLSVAVAALPMGLNCVVYPESMGLDATSNAKMCFVSCLVSIVTLPVIFALLPEISGI